MPPEIMKPQIVVNTYNRNDETGDWEAQVNPPQMEFETDQNYKIRVKAAETDLYKLQQAKTLLRELEKELQKKSQLEDFEQ